MTATEAIPSLNVEPDIRWRDNCCCTLELQNVSARYDEDHHEAAYGLLTIHWVHRAWPSFDRGAAWMCIIQAKTFTSIPIHKFQTLRVSLL